MNSAREQEDKELLHKATKLYAKGEYSQAFQIYQQLADSGHSDSQVFLGIMFIEGKGVEASYEGAARWFRRAALLGSAKGAFYMGRLLTREAKYADAVLWYQRSAADGYAPSQFRLGVSYLRGEGVQKNLSSACRYLEAAKANGHIFAMRELAVLDIRGDRGVTRRFLGVIEITLVLLCGIGLAVTNPYSDNLKW